MASSQSVGAFDPQPLTVPSGSGGLVRHASGPRNLHRLGSNIDRRSLSQVGADNNINTSLLLLSVIAIV